MASAATGAIWFVIGWRVKPSPSVALSEVSLIGTIDVERQGFDAHTRVVGADDAVEALVDRGVGGVHAGLCVTGIIDRDDFDFPIEKATALIDFVGGHLGTLEHSVAEHGEVTGERCLQADPPGIGGVATGVAAGDDE
jgi:hypothetical protein